MITNFLKETLKEKWDEGRGLFLIPEKIQLFFFFRFVFTYTVRRIRNSLNAVQSLFLFI